MNYIEQKQAIETAIAEFPKTFALRAFPNEVFSISAFHSYVSEDRVYLYVGIERPDGLWEAMSKGTPDELRREIVQLYPKQPTTPVIKTSVPETGAIDAAAVLFGAMRYICTYDEIFDDFSNESAAYAILENLERIVKAEKFINGWALRGCGVTPNA
jgi:hypothetical protein